MSAESRCVLLARCPEIAYAQQAPIQRHTDTWMIGVSLISA